MQKRWQKAKTGVGVARPTKMRAVSLRFAKTSTQVLVFANLRVGRWLGLPKWKHQGPGGWECKNEDSKARICGNEHLGACFHKSESWAMAGPAKMGTLGVGGWDCKN